MKWWVSSNNDWIRIHRTGSADSDSGDDAAGSAKKTPESGGSEERVADLRCPSHIFEEKNGLKGRSFRKKKDLRVRRPLSWRMAQAAQKKSTKQKGKRSGAVLEGGRVTENGCGACPKASSPPTAVGSAGRLLQRVGRLRFQVLY